MKCISIFKCNPQVEVIDKRFCHLEDVPNFLNYSKSLEELFLDANRLTLLNENVFKLTKLRRLSLRDNYIQDIPPDIARLVNLVELDCHKNEIQFIPEQIKFLRGLQICDFSANYIEYLPPGLVQLKNLTCLNLNNCAINNLPDDIGLLKNLESLELRENKLQYLPTSITDLESLEKLDVGINFITELPEDIGKLTRLEYLLVDGNKLQTVPIKIGKLENLQCLDLCHQNDEESEEGELRYLPEEIGGLVSLTDLHLSKNCLKTLPDGIINLKNLTIFKADENYLTELNPNIGGCKALQELVLTGNQITKLPSSIGNLTDLRSLNVDKNFIDRLPPQIGELKRLGILSLKDNHLTHLPNEIGQLELVKVMDISGNKLEYLPVSIAALNLRALWLSKNQAQPLPKLQIDELPDSGTKILTCYLLPQQSEGTDQPLERAPSIPTDYDYQRQAAVSFDTAAIDDAELSKDAQFVRQNTPHPRELKARHQKLFDTSQTRPELEAGGHVNPSFTMADNNHKYDYDSQDQNQNNNTVQAGYHMNYDSNGLPEITNSSSRVQYNSSSKHNKDPVAQNYRDQASDNHHQFHDDYNNQENNRPTSYQQNGLNQFRTKTQTSSTSTSIVRSSSQQLSSSSDNQILDILVRRSKNHKPGLGLSIAGGKDTPPYMDNDEGIFVSKVTRGGPAEAADVRVGDKILAVNNNIFYEGITHQKAVDIFKKVKPDCIEFTMRVMRFPESAFIDQEEAEDEHSVRADANVGTTKPIERVLDRVASYKSNYTVATATEAPATNGTKASTFQLKQQLLKDHGKSKSTSSTLPPGLGLSDSASTRNIIYTTLVKDYKHDLGLVLENRSDDDSRNNWSNIVIADIKPNSLASRDAKLQVNDKLLFINGIDVTGIDLERIMLMLEGTDRFIRIVVSRGDSDDPLGIALKNMPTRPQLGSWFSSASNMSHRPSLAESYQGPKFGSATSLVRQSSLLAGAKPPKPPKPYHLQAENLIESPDSAKHSDDNPTARPRGFIKPSGAAGQNDNSSEMSDAERRAAWRRDRLRSIEDDVEMAKLIAEAQRRRREEK